VVLTGFLHQPELIAIPRLAPTAFDQHCNPPLSEFEGAGGHAPMSTTALVFRQFLDRDVAPAQDRPSSS